MHGDSLSDDDLVRLFRAGDETAATGLYLRYAPRLAALAEARRAPGFASRFDPEDVVQTVFRDLFARLRHDPEPPAGPLWGFLLVLALNHIRSLVEHHSAARRSVRRTCSADGDGDRTLSVPDRRERAAQTAAALWEQADALAEPDRKVVRMRLEGYEVAEIATRTGRSRRTVERVLHDFRERVTTVS